MIIREYIISEEKHWDIWCARWHAQFVRAGSPPWLIFLSGDLGVGKTVFARSWLHCCGITATIRSPSFPILYSYPNQHRQWHHIDCYRLHSPYELLEIGFEDMHQRDGILMEWPEHVEGIHVVPDVHLYLTIHGKGRRLQMHSEKIQGPSWDDFAE